MHLIAQPTARPIREARAAARATRRRRPQSLRDGGDRRPPPVRQALRRALEPPPCHSGAAGALPSDPCGQPLRPYEVFDVVLRRARHADVRFRGANNPLLRVELGDGLRRARVDGVRAAPACSRGDVRVAHRRLGPAVGSAVGPPGGGGGGRGPMGRRRLGRKSPQKKDTASNRPPAVVRPVRRAGRPRAANTNHLTGSAARRATGGRPRRRGSRSTRLISSITSEGVASSE